MTEKPGPTGEFPAGMLRPDDKGELNLAITHTHGRVVVLFGTEVKWLGMEPDTARALAMELLERADKAQIQLAEAIEGKGH